MEVIKLNNYDPKQLRKGIRPPVAGHDDLENYFEFEIQEISRLAIGPYFWFIPDNHTGNILSISENAKNLTPFSKEEWLNPNNPIEFFSEFIHPEDRYFVFSAIDFALKKAEFYLQLSQKIKVSIFARMLDKHKNFRWMLMQFPKFYFDEKGLCQSLIAFLTDFSLFSNNTESMMTVLLENGDTQEMFKVVPTENSMDKIPTAKISKREKEIISLMIQGATTRQIAEKLNLSFYTIENHKKNIRQKTGKRTSPELTQYFLQRFGIGF